MKIIHYLLMATLLVGFAVAADSTQSASTPKAAKSIKAKVAPAQLPTLIFFMNPNGAPCQMQYKILQDGMADLNKQAKIRYVKTTEDADQNTFYQYGIRSLPSLILVDSTGKELHRFAPGIQDMQTILATTHK